MVKNLQTYATPRMPGLHMIQPAIVTTEMMARMPLYQSAVGTLLFLLKHSRPDLASPIRELSKVLDCPTEMAFKEVKRVIKFVLDMKDYGLQIKPMIDAANAAWSIMVFSDSNYVGDAKTHVSVIGFCIFLLGVPICCQRPEKHHPVIDQSQICC